MRQYIFLMFTVVCGVINAVCNEVPFVLDYDYDYSRLVKSDIRQNGFEKGEWGNEDYQVIPARWNSRDAVYFVMSRPDEKDRRGANWCAYKLDSNSRVMESSVDGEGSDGQLSFYKDVLHVVDYVDGSSELLFYKEIVSKQNNSLDILVDEVNCFTFGLGVDGRPHVKPVNGGFVSLYRNTKVKAITHIFPKTFRGKDGESLSSRIVTVRPIGVLEGRVCRDVIDIHAKSLRKHNPKCIYLIAADVNGDGTLDAYLSSDVERKSGEGQLWSLYLGGPNGLVAATDDIHLEGKREETYVDRRVIAKKDYFFSVNAEGMPNYVMVMTDGKSGLVSWAYTAHANATKTYRRIHGDERFAAGACLNSNPSCRMMKDVKDLYGSTWSGIFRLERLECHEFPVPSEQAIDQK